ncbi:hypothetical protein [Streptomyces montanisoli]|uniref:Uncharacterized protein n=1 Tax=Streptomyces montanisoli TaxID=2798581 RepID=A0A940RYW9_9ACTN|nr:hypothetical protein [Streptomyces montanisoli]MBP0461980.1 hypothetical protein [Streptomyces montanisoli]
MRRVRHGRGFHHLTPDGSGRRQYLYHEEYRARRERAKHAHVREAALAPPRLRERVAEALALHGRVAFGHPGTRGAVERAVHELRG